MKRSIYRQVTKFMNYLDYGIGSQRFIGLNKEIYQPKHDLSMIDVIIYFKGYALENLFINIVLNVINLS